MLTRYGILRERFADTLTDALRAALLRREGYRVDVVEFVESAHTPAQHAAPRRAAARRGGVAPTPQRGRGGRRREYDDLLAAWGVRPRLGAELGLSR